MFLFGKAIKARAMAKHFEPRNKPTLAKIKSELLNSPKISKSNISNKVAKRNGLHGLKNFASTQINPKLIADLEQNKYKIDLKLILSK